ncbi:hypothetical protein HY570_03575 [Candidatus Micrarchaeota archaeon]|nr:hypothetical protein [Candidatus Micrarchaeota archaeon]
MPLALNSQAEAARKELMAPVYRQIQDLQGRGVLDAPTAKAFTRLANQINQGITNGTIGIGEGSAGKALVQQLSRNLDLCAQKEGLTKGKIFESLMHSIMSSQEIDARDARIFLKRIGDYLTNPLSFGKPEQRAATIAPAEKITPEEQKATQTMSAISMIMRSISMSDRSRDAFMKMVESAIHEKKSSTSETLELTRAADELYGLIGKPGETATTTLDEINRVLASNGYKFKVETRGDWTRRLESAPSVDKVNVPVSLKFY